MSSSTQRSNIGSGVSQRRSSSRALGTRVWSPRSLRQRVRVAEQRPPRIPCPVDRCLVTGIEQERARPHELALREDVARIGHLRQPRDEVVPRIGTTDAREVAEVVAEGGRRDDRPLL